MKTITILFALFFSVVSHSQTHIWNDNSGDHNWFNAANWDAGTVPTASSTVLIENGLVNIITSAATAMSIDLSLNVTLTVENNLSVSGDIHISGPSFLVIESGTLSNATIHNFGSLIFQDLAPKYIENVTINNHLSMAVLNSGVIHLDNTVNINNMDTGMVSINSPGGMIEDSGVATFHNQGSIILDSPSPKSFYMIFDMNNEGIIEVRDSHTFLFLVASQNFTNLPNGTLMGEGAFDITANFVNHGTIDPASNATTGTLDVVNNLHFPSEATLKIDVTSTTEYDVLAVFGSPTMEGALEINLLSELNLNDELTIITSSNALNCNLPSQVEAPFGEFDVYIFDVICTTNSVVLKVNSILLNNDTMVFEKEAFVASPNPAKEVVSFTISPSVFQNSLSLNIEVYSLLGQKLATLHPSEEKLSFDSASFASGIYVAKLISEKGLVATTKLVVE